MNRSIGASIDSFRNIQMLYLRLHESDLKEVAHLDSLNKPTLSAIFPGYFFDRKRALKSKASIDFETIYGQVGVNGSTFSNYSLATQDRLEGLKKYLGGVTLIQGRQDPIGESTLFEIIDILPQSEAHFIEKCGHFPWLENDQQVGAFYGLLYVALESK